VRGVVSRGGLQRRLEGLEAQLNPSVGFDAWGQQDFRSAGRVTRAPLDGCKTMEIVQCL
jgi:hypothetical protein